MTAAMESQLNPLSWLSLFFKERGWLMRKRNCRVEVCFTKDELSDLTKKVWKAHLSIGGFIRRAVRNIEIKETPPADVPMLIREVRRVGYNIDQLLLIARAKNWLSAKDLEKALESNRAAEKLIVDTYTTPSD